MENRVAIYNRCSTEEEAQRNALEIQAVESREIAQKKGWQITAQYIESESGTTIKNRKEYQKLFEAMEQDLFDIVMIKSIDRLMRSTKDWYLFIDRLAAYHKKLYIYIENKFYEPEDSLISGIKAILAEDFSRELSKKIKHAHKRRQDTKSGLNITVPLFGWEKIGKDSYRIQEEEAMYYRLAFAMADEGHGFHFIAKYLYEQGVRSKVTGGMISAVQWRNMLYSPRAHGTVILHKREYDFYTKKYVNLPPQQWIAMENALPPIVEEAYQQNVLCRIEERNAHGVCYDTKKTAGAGNPKKLLAGKLYCSCCGQVYYRCVMHKGEKRELIEWKCKTKLTKGKALCSNRNVIEDSVMESIEHIWKPQETKGFDKTGLLETVMQMSENILEKRDREEQLQKQEKQLQELEKNKEVLFYKLMEGVIPDADFRIINAKVSKQIEELKEKIAVQKNAILQEDSKERLLAIRKCLQESDILQNAERKANIQQIQKIVVYPNNKLELHYLEQGNLVKKQVPYVHKDNIYKKREQINQKLLEILQENPQITLKEVIPMFEVKASYIHASIKQLKEEGRLRYKRTGSHMGEWQVSNDVFGKK